MTPCLSIAGRLDEDLQSQFAKAVSKVCGSDVVSLDLLMKSCFGISKKTCKTHDGKGGHYGNTIALNTVSEGRVCNSPVDTHSRLVRNSLSSFTG